MRTDRPGIAPRHPEPSVFVDRTPVYGLWGCCRSVSVVCRPSRRTSSAGPDSSLYRDGSGLRYFRAPGRSGGSVLVTHVPEVEDSGGHRGLDRGSFWLSTVILPWSRDYSRSGLDTSLPHPVHSWTMCHPLVARDPTHDPGVTSSSRTEAPRDPTVILLWGLPWTRAPTTRFPSRTVPLPQRFDPTTQCPIRHTRLPGTRSGGDGTPVP